MAGDILQPHRENLDGTNFNVVAPKRRGGGHTEQLDGAQWVLLERVAAQEACLCISQFWSLILLLVPPKFGAKQSGECVGLEKGHFSAATRKLDCDVLE